MNYCQIKMIHAVHHFTPILILSKNIDIPPITEWLRIECGKFMNSSVLKGRLAIANIGLTNIAWVIKRTAGISHQTLISVGFISFKDINHIQHFYLFRFFL